MSRAFTLDEDTSTQLTAPSMEWQLSVDSVRPSASKIADELRRASTLAVVALAAKFRKKNKKEGNADVETLRRRMKLNAEHVSTGAQRSALDLMNKVTGLLLAVKLEDGDIEDRPSSSSEIGSPPKSGREKQQQRVKHLFGGQRVTFSHRSETLHHGKATSAQDEVAKEQRQRLIEEKRKWRTTTHQFTSIQQAKLQEEEEAEGSPNTVALSMQDVRGQARAALQHNFSREQELVKEESSSDDSDDIDAALAMPLRTKQALYGSEKAYDVAMKQDRERRRQAVETMKDRQRQQSITDVSMLQPMNRKVSVVEGAARSELWAREEDEAEMFAEYISCVRHSNEAWKQRFLPPRPPPSSRGGMSDTGDRSTLLSPVSRETPMEDPKEDDTFSLLPSLAPSPRRPKVAPTLRESTPVRLPAVNPAMLSRLIVDLVELSGGHNAVAPLPKLNAAKSNEQHFPFQAVQPKARCPHCTLLASAVDNQSLLSLLHSCAATSSPPSRIEKALGLANMDTSLYTGVIADGSAPHQLVSMSNLMPTDVTLESLGELDKVMWRHVATMVQSSDPKRLEAVAANAATGAQRQCATELEAAFKHVLTTDTTWSRQMESLQLARDREVRSLYRAIDEQKRLYNGNLSTLRAVQMECDNLEAEHSKLQRRGDAESVLGLQQHLLALEKEIEGITMSLCDEEFQRREIKKNLSKCLWTSEALQASCARLGTLRGTLLGILDPHRPQLGTDDQYRLQLDVAAPIDDTEAARTLYGLTSADVLRTISPISPSSTPSSPLSPGKISGASRLKNLVATKIMKQRSSLLATFKDAVATAQDVDYTTDDVLADIDEIIRAAAANKDRRVSTSTASPSPKKGPSTTVVDTTVVKESLDRLLGRRCTQCDLYLGSSKYCSQTGALHSSMTADGANRSRVGTAYRVMWCNSKLASEAHTVLRYSPSADDQVPDSEAASFEITEMKSQIMTSSKSMSYPDRKRAKEVAAAVRRRSSMMLARKGDSKWQEEVQKDSSDDSELEYADADEDSEEEEILVRRSSTAQLLQRDDSRSSDALKSAVRRRSLVTNSQSSPVAGSSRRGSKHFDRAVLIGFTFGDGGSTPRSQAAELDDDPLTMIVSKRRQSAVKTRINQRKRFKETALRTRLLATLVPGGVQNDGGATREEDKDTKRYTDMATVNLLTILSQELRWRLTAQTTEGLPGSGVLGHLLVPPTQSPAQAALSLEPLELEDGGAPLMRKYAKSTQVAKSFEGVRPPTTSIVSGHGSAAAALASIAASGPMGALYPLWYPSAMERKVQLQQAELSWVQRIAPMLAQISDDVVARSHRLHGTSAPSPSKGLNKSIRVGGGAPKKADGSKSPRTKPVVIPGPPGEPVGGRTPSPPKAARAPAATEQQLNESIDRFKRIVAVVQVPTRQTLQKLMGLERQVDDLNRQLKQAQERERKAAAQAATASSMSMASTDPSEVDITVVT